MRTRALVIITLTITTLFIGCKKDNLEIEEGLYTGTFTVTYSNGKMTGATTVELKNSRFICSGNANRIPAGGFGTYSIDKGHITFHDENFWTAEFDWGLILAGKYDYSFDGKMLILSKGKYNDGHYQYILEKI